VIADEPVHVYETSRAGAEEAGALANFGDKYGERVRVVEAGSVSVELCGGTHVHALGMIGPLRIVSESSIGANTRRIEATTGARSLEEIRAAERALARAAASLRTSPGDVPVAAERLLGRERELEDELKRLRLAELAAEAGELAARAGSGRVVVRRDGLDPAALRELALKVRDHDGVDAVALVGSPDGQKVALVVAARPGSGVDARAVAAAAGAAIGGGGGGSAELATAGGRNAAGVDGAVALLRDALTVAGS
jgi:alanyl-tRNA synthetase